MLEEKLMVLENIQDALLPHPFPQTIILKLGNASKN